MKIDLILQSVKEIFLEHPDPNRHDFLILELLRIILENNDFEFDGNFIFEYAESRWAENLRPVALIFTYVNLMREL